MAYRTAVKKILLSLLKVAIIFLAISANERFASCAPSLSLQSDNVKSHNQQEGEEEVLSLKLEKTNSHSGLHKSVEEDAEGHPQGQVSPKNVAHNSVLSHLAEDKIVTNPEVQPYHSHNERSGSLKEINPTNVIANHIKATVLDSHHELPRTAPSEDAVAKALKTLGLSASVSDQDFPANKRPVEGGTPNNILQNHPQHNNEAEATVRLENSQQQDQGKKNYFISAERTIPLHPLNVQEKFSSFDKLKAIFLSKTSDTNSDDEIYAPKQVEKKYIPSFEQPKEGSISDSVVDKSGYQASASNAPLDEGFSPSGPDMLELPSEEASDSGNDAGSTVELHPRSRIARVSRILDDDAIRTYPTRPSSSMLPAFPGSSSAKSLVPGAGAGENASDQHWQDKDIVLSSEVFPARDKTTDSTREKTHLSSDRGTLGLDDFKSSGAHDAKFGEQTVLFDNQKEVVKVIDIKSGEEDERNMDGRGEQDGKSIRLTNAHIESSITDNLILGKVKDEVENLVGNHKSIEATPTLKDKLRVNTIVQPLEDTSHGTKGSQIKLGSGFRADSTASVLTYETRRHEMEDSGLKDSVSSIEEVEKFSSETPFKEASSSVDSVINKIDGATSHVALPVPSVQEGNETPDLKNELVIKDVNERASDPGSESDHSNEIVKDHLDVIENKNENLKSVLKNPEIFDGPKISHKRDGVPDSRPEGSDGSSTFVDESRSGEKSPQSNLGDSSTGNYPSQTSGVKVIRKASVSTVPPELHENFPDVSLAALDTPTLNVSDASVAASPINTTALPTTHSNETVETEDSATLQSNNSLTATEDIKSDEEPSVVTESEAMEGDDVHTVNQSEESDTDKTLEGKQKDSIETYSQFAERVTMEKMNDGNGQSGSTKGGSGSTSSPNVPRLSAGKKYNNKNYAAPDCGSKLLAANPEAQHASSVIKRDRDDYLLNDCKSKTWFIVELCESIRPSRFEIANFELFSNLPKDVVVYGSQRYPSRDWTLLGEYIGEPANRGVQAFPVTTEPFFKYIKVEILSHYGSEYYCPVSLFQVYGVSEFEVIDSLEDGSEEIEEEPVELAEPKKEEKKERSMFPTVLRSVLYNVLGALNKAPFFSIASKSNQTPPVDECSTLDPRYKIDERKCSLAPTINWHLGCYDTEYRYLLKMPLIEQTVQSREFCKTLVDNLCTEKGNKEMVEEDIKEGKHVLSGSQVDLNYACSKEVCGDSYVCIMLCSHHLLALCHIKHFNLSSSSSSSNSSVSCEDANIPNNRSVNDKTTQVPSSNFVLKDAVVPEKSEITDLSDKKINKEEASSQVRDNAESSVPQKDNMSDSEGNKTESNLSFGNGKLAADVELAHSSNEEPEGTGTKKSSSKKEKKVEGSNQDKKTFKNDVKKDPPSESKHGGNVVRNGDNGGSKNGNGSPLPTVEQDPPAPSKEGNGGNVAAAPVNKESVVVRLSNKIKALEHNLSINSQYLEELSRRYKQQMEEMQLQFSAAVSALNATRPLPSASPEQESESDVMQEQVLQLQIQMQQLSEMVSQLSVEQETFSSSVVHQHLVLMFVELFLLLTTFWLCMRRQHRQISDQLYRRNPNQLSYATRDALPCTDRDESPPVHESCAQMRRQNGDQLLALQWANEEKNDGQRIQDKKLKPFDKPKHQSDNSLQRSGSVDNSKHNKRRKSDRRASMHSLNKAGPFQDLLRDCSSTSSTKRKKRSKTSTKTCALQPALFEPSNSARLLQKCASEIENAPFTHSCQSGASSAERGTSQKDDTIVTASPSPIASWASKIEGQNSSLLKGSYFDYINDEIKCGTSSKLLETTALSEDISGSMEDSAIVAEALEIAIKQGKKVSKETLARLLLAKMSNEKRIKLAKETRREANKRKNLNKSSAGVLFSCEKHFDKKKECPKKDQELSGTSGVCAQPYTDSSNKSAISSESGIQSTAEDRIRSCLPCLHFPCCPVAGTVHTAYPINSLVTENSQLMRISECSESSGILNTSLETEFLSDSSESPLRSVFSQRFSSGDPHFDRRSSSASTKQDLELEDLFIAMSRMGNKSILPHSSSLPELKSNIATSERTDTKGASSPLKRRDSDLYTSYAIQLTDSLSKPVLVNGSHADEDGATHHHHPSLVKDGSKQNSNYVWSETDVEHSSKSAHSTTLQNGSWMQVGGKSSSKAQHVKKKSGHKRSGSDGLLSYNGKSDCNRTVLKTNSNSVIEKKKNRKLKRNVGYGSLGDSISSHCGAVVNGEKKFSAGSCSNILASVRRASETRCSAPRLGDQKCRSAEEERQKILAGEEEGER